MAKPVIALVAPGPDVTKATPGLPVALAYPSAACTAPCSCLTRICFIDEEYAKCFRALTTNAYRSTREQKCNK